jgi:hypothetical protein
MNILAIGLKQRTSCAQITNSPSTEKPLENARVRIFGQYAIKCASSASKSLITEELYAWFSPATRPLGSEREFSNSP